MRTHLTAVGARGCDSWCWPKGAQSLGTYSSPWTLHFFPPHIGAEPRRTKRESRITCNSSYYAVHVNVSCNTFFSLRLEKNSFTGVDVVVKNKLKCGLSLSVLLSTRSTHHYSFPEHFFALFLHVEWVCKSFWKESLTGTSTSFA